MSWLRPHWEQYWLCIAAVVSTRSTCNRKRVGAVLVREGRVLSTGYSGSMPGQPHCIDAGCELGPDGGCQRTVHAEMNAIAQAAANGVSTRGSDLFCTLSPCPACFKLLVNAGVKRIFFSEDYRIPIDRDLARSCGVSLEHVVMERP